MAHGKITPKQKLAMAAWPLFLVNAKKGGGIAIGDVGMIENVQHVFCALVRIE